MQTSNSLESNPSLNWARVNEQRQKLYIGINSWEYKVSPYMSDQDQMNDGEYGSCLLFQFEGDANINGSTKLGVTASIEVLEPNEEIGMLRDHWDNVPKIVQGYGFLIHEKDEPILSASIGLTLLCRKDALDPLYKAFMCGFSSSNGRIGLEVNLSYPDEMDDDFWGEQWRDKWLEISGWRVFSGVDRQIDGLE